MRLKDLPQDARPGEKLLACGPGAFVDAELLALLLLLTVHGRELMASLVQ